MAGFPGHLFVIDGEPGAIRGSAARWAAFGEAALSARATLDQLDTGQFIGTEADMWREGLNKDMPAHLATTGHAYTQVAGALATFSDELSTLQDLMRPIAGRAPALWEALQQATGALADARADDAAHTAARQDAADARADDDPPLPADTYQARTGGASAALSAAQRAWDDAVAAAAGLIRRLTSASATATHTINEAKGQRFTENPHWYDLGGQFTNLVRDHADALAKLSGALKIVSAVAGVLAFIPVLTPIAAPIALATGAAALAIDGSLYAATGRGSLTGLLVDGALMALPGVGRLASLARGAHAADAAVDTTRAADAVGDATRAGDGASDAARAADDLPAVGPGLTPSMRTDRDLLYRADNRDPDTIFTEGFQPKDPTNSDLADFVQTNRPSNFVSTSRNPDLYQNWGSEYRYTVDAPGGIDVNRTLGPHAFQHEQEIAFAGGLGPQQVVGVHPVLPSGTLGEFVPNPSYVAGG
jgi:hypothetical protein